MKLDYLQALKRVDEARGVWILHGQEPLLEQNLIDAFSTRRKEIEVLFMLYDVKTKVGRDRIVIN